MADEISQSSVPLWIDNQPVKSNTTFPVVNAGNGNATSAYGATADIVKSAIQSSHRAFTTWRRTTPWERRDLLLNAARLLSERSDAVRAILEVETPVDDFIKDLNICGAIDQLNELASHVLEATKSIVQPSKLDRGGLIMTVKEPIGVNLAIAPWNASLLLAMRAVATPIACGNTVVLKASEMSPLAHNFLGELFRDSGFPPGVLNIVQHSREDASVIVDALVSDDRVRMVNFTGSTAVGRIVAAKAAQYGKPCLLELGGKCPQIVLADADLDKAAQAAVFGAFAHHGQICMSTERIIVDKAVIGLFENRLASLVRNATSNSSGASVANTSKVAAIVTDAVAQGARLLLGGSTNTMQNGLSLTPQILTKVTRDMDIWHTETFGPVAVLVGFETIEEAIDMANDSDYGLSASIFTADTSKALHIARLLDSGAVHINSTTVHDEAHAPHGGSKGSGWGRFGVPWGFSEFTQLKTITIPSYQGGDI